MPRTQRRRLLTGVAASLIALALVAGCGGSDVDQAAGSGTEATQVEPGADTAPVTGTGIEVSTTGGAAVAVDVPATATDALPAQGTKPTDGTAVAGKPATSGDTTAAKGSTRGGKAPAADAGSVGTLVATHPIFGGKGACKPATLSEVPLGNVSTMSGVLGELLSPVRPALETFVASQNACGGLNGHKIKMYFEDDLGDPSTASSKVQGMIQSKKILAFVGNIQVLTIDAVVPIIKRSGIPMIGGDLVSNTWYTNPLLFPQGAGPGGVAYGYLLGATDFHQKKNVGNIWCIEVPRACEQLDRAFKELAPGMGATVKKSIQASITQPSYVQQCLEFKNAGVEALALVMDAASMNRIARSCEQVGYFPKVMPTSLGVGNEKQFLTGNKWLGNSYVAMTYFPWFADETPAQKYWQASVKKYNPGFTQGGAASTGWTAGVLLVAAAANLSTTNPTSADLLKTLYSFQGQKFTELGGFTPPLTFREGSTPKVPYCLFAGISNADNTAWARSVAVAKCTDIVAGSDPQKGS